MSEKLVISAVLAIALLAAYGAGYVEGKDVGESTIRKQWNAEKDRVTVAEAHALTQRMKENAQQAAEQAATSTQIKQGFQDEKQSNDSLRSIALAGLRNTKAGNCDSGSAKTAGTGNAEVGRPEAAAAARILPETGVQDIFDLLYQADQVTAQCRAMQSFIEKNGMQSHEN